MLSRLATLVGQTVLIGLITLGLLELLVAASFMAPRLSVLPRPLLQYLYTNIDRNTIQVMPACARYDPAVTYTLRPGHCTFANREFSTQYDINALGLRDDDASLQQPEAVMLGDSLTMGWGVEQDETFAARFERLTGLRTLNAGVSSYGTVRELRMFARIDRSRVKLVVIAYMDNDFLENEQFAATGTLKILSEAEYLRTVENQATAQRYFPGKYALNLLAQLRAAVRRRAAAAVPPSADRQAEVFLKVLDASPVPLAGVRVAVTSFDPSFIAAVTARAPVASSPWARAIQPIDLSALRRTGGAFYVLDDHPTAAGHAAIAAALVQWAKAEQ